VSSEVRYVRYGAGGWERVNVSVVGGLGIRGSCTDFFPIV
jgi:hypothetical protein